MTSLCAGARVTAIMSTRCYGDDIGFRPNVTSLSSGEIDRAGNGKMASAKSRPTHAVLAVISPTRRPSHSDVRDHETVNTNQIYSQAVLYAPPALNYQTSDDTLIVHHHYHHYQQLQQQNRDAEGRTQSAWNRRSNLCHSLKMTSSSTSSPTEATASPSRAVTSRQRAERRRAATDRERHRLRRVNAAFDVLRERTCYHVISDVTPRPLPVHRLSKLDILRRAISYIEHLEHLLNNNVHISRICNIQQTVNVVSD